MAPVSVSRLPIFAALAQGFFCVVLGLWPVVGIHSFESIAGVAPDHWCLTVASLLLATIGVSLLISAIRRDIAVEVFVLGIATALALAVSEVAFFVARRIPAVHLLDATAEILFVALWVFALRDLRRKGRAPLPFPSIPPISATLPNPGDPMNPVDSAKPDYITLGFEKIDRDLQFLIGCLADVLAISATAISRRSCPGRAGRLPREVPAWPRRRASSIPSPSSC